MEHRSGKREQVTAGHLAVFGCLCLLATPLRAQELQAFPPPGWHARSIRIEGGQNRVHHRTVAGRVGAVTGERSLTINRRFGEADLSDARRSDVTDDAGTLYGDIRSFNPFPYVTSGEQLPYGLDGIGGFGRDYGFAADEDASVYQRSR